MLKESVGDVNKAKDYNQKEKLIKMDKEVEVVQNSHLKNILEINYQYNQGKSHLKFQNLKREIRIILNNHFKNAKATIEKKKIRKELNILLKDNKMITFK